MPRPKSVTLINYEKVNPSYLQSRKLKGSANQYLLWGLGVGAVISGDFFGWNFGLAAGGFWGLAIATILMAIMYVCMVYSIAELSTALPHAGGFYSFTRSAFGSFWGYVCGVAMLIEYVVTPAVIAVGITGYLKPFVPTIPLYLLWLLAYGIFVAINIWSVEITFYVGFLLTLVSMMMLGIFYISMLASGVFEPELLFNIPPDPGQASWLPKGSQGIFAAIPYAIWFYLAIEQLPLAAEETEQPERNLPRALIFGVFTLLVLSLLTLVLNSGVGGGALAIGQSSVPLQDGLETYFGKGSTSTLVSAFALICGLVASFHAIIYAYGRVLFSLSRAGYLPRWLSVTGKTHTPYRALILGAIVGLLCTVIMDNSGSTALGAVLLNMAVFGAVISYILVMLSYIQLKLNRPDLPRPYQSPLGIFGAAVGAILAFVALFACLAIPAYQPGILGVSIFLIVMILYFFFHSKNHLVAQAPEEKTALLALIQRRKAVSPEDKGINLP
ncbi:ethanolamine permease [Merismopedia glauca]|uniref:Ethanolamine permease n=1 Tax=Merismopedia glauca CCAP 1448/3 TaxID=1296344 RepID=A0A2T1BWU8_9CYAN|nr:ethanolamine permease [Merismopedia glauca]PSB00489.1 ethanolamine permease [Merismopedia glauca CCAP 1448/3]